MRQALIDLFKPLLNLADNRIGIGTVGFVDGAADNFMITVEQADPAAKSLVDFDIGDIFYEYRVLVTGGYEGVFNLIQRVQQS